MSRDDSVTPSHTDRVSKRSGTIQLAAASAARSNSPVVTAVRTASGWVVITEGSLGAEAKLHVLYRQKPSPAERDTCQAARVVDMGALDILRSVADLCASSRNAEAKAVHYHHTYFLVLENCNTIAE